MQNASLFKRFSMYKMSLTLLASMIMGSALPLDMHPVTRGIKTKCTHLVHCVQGKETCNKTDWAILATGLVFARSALHMIVELGAYKYKRPHAVDTRADYRSDRKSFMGRCFQKIDQCLKWGPGNFPQKLITEARMRWSKELKHKTQSRSQT